MGRTLVVIIAALAGLLVAVPALAQEPFYGEVLPEDLERPGDGTVAPDAEEAPAPGARAGGEQRGEHQDGQSGRAPGHQAGNGADRGVSAAGERGVVVAGRQLPVTGFGLLAFVVLALGLIGGGAAALTIARRRTRAADPPLAA